VAADNVSVLLKKGESADKVTQEIIMDKKVKAPVKKGTPLGTLIVKNGNEVISRQSIVASEDIDAASWWELFKQSFGMFSKSK
jgi:D-alanyl-D-alanine carboxypeptidase (penicillin-binding protein 5/6)